MTEARASLRTFGLVGSSFSSGSVAKDALARLSPYPEGKRLFSTGCSLSCALRLSLGQSNDSRPRKSNWTSPLASRSKRSATPPPSEPGNQATTNAVLFSSTGFIHIGRPVKKTVAVGIPCSLSVSSIFLTRSKSGACRSETSPNPSA